MSKKERVPADRLIGCRFVPGRGLKEFLAALPLPPAKIDGAVAVWAFDRPIPDAYALGVGLEKWVAQQGRHGTRERWKKPEAIDVSKLLSLEAFTAAMPRMPEEVPPTPKAEGPGITIEAPKAAAPGTKFIPDGIPAEMKTLKNWVVWGHGPEGVRKAPREPLPGFPMAEGDEPSTFHNFTDCEAFARQHGLGVGFQLLGSGLLGFDLDKCVKGDGSLSPAAERIVALSKDSVTWQLSPSGTGLRGFGRGNYDFINATKDKWTDPSVGGEVAISREGHVTVTGVRWRDSTTQLGDCQAVLDWIKKELKPSDKSQAKGAKYDLGELLPVDPPLTDMEDPRIAKLSAETRWIIFSGWETQNPEWCAAAAEVGIDVGRHEAGSGSRNGAQHRVSLALVGAGIDDSLHYHILTSEQLGISRAIYLTQGEKRRSGWASYARKQIVKAHEKVGPPPGSCPELSCDKKGTPLPTYENVRIAATKIGVELRYNEFTGRTDLKGLPAVFGSELDDASFARIHRLFQDRFRFSPPVELARRGLEDMSMDSSFHPVRDYLTALKWDGVPRIDRWLIDHCGAKDTPFVRAVGSIFLRAGVKRVLEPGCKFDEMVVLHSPEGYGKSSLAEILAKKPEWHGDEIPFGDTKALMELTEGVWIVEVGELSDIRKSEVERQKLIMSRTKDRARKAYGRFAKTIKRQFVCLGTTNNERFLKSLTGNRRFWPVKTERNMTTRGADGRSGLDVFAAEVDQLWAEAVARRTESIRLPSELWGDAQEAQEARAIVHPYEEMLDGLLDGFTGRIRTGSVAKLLRVDLAKVDTTVLGGIMKSLGWEKVRRREDGEPRWWYARGTEKEQERTIEVTPDGRPLLEVGGK